MRYGSILDEIRRIGARVVLEVGTWDGRRAVEMLKTCEAARGGGLYYGFDLFEDMTEAKSKKEFNVKAPAPFASVSALLDSLIAGKPWLNYRLFKGDTRKTLPAFVGKSPEAVDLAWIDGGHSVDTIASDYKNVLATVRPGGVVLLDDYYTGMPRNFISKFGCNRLVAELIEENGNVTLFPEKDPVKGGGYVQIARVDL